MLDAINLFDFEALARQRVDATAWDYFASGADDELTLRAARAAYQAIALHYRVLVDVAERDLSTTVLGTPVSMPILVAPTAFQKLAHPDGELGTTRAAGDAGTIMILSTLSTTPVEAVTAAATGPVWFQLYVYRDRTATEALVRRVEEAGCTALVLTVDAPVLGRRERDVRNRFALPADLRIECLLPAGYAAMPPGREDSGLAAYFASMLDPGLSWSDLAWLRSITRLPIVVKGIARTDDARRARDHGAAAIVVSNHGGRQLDTAPPTIQLVEPIARAVGGELEVLVDGGVRRGTDVVKALALGARAVLLGRPILWGLGAGGADGVGAVLSLLRDELDRALSLCGCAAVREVGIDLIRPPP